MSGDIRPRLTVDLGALGRNARALRAMRPEAELVPVVKADCYGLGAEKIVPVLMSEGCTSFFVSYPEEARALYGVTDGCAFYCLNAAPGSGPYTERCRPVLYRLEDLTAWDGGSCAVQVEIGMHRMGIRPSELEGLPPRPDVAMVVAHMSHAGDPKAADNDRQRALFAELRAKLSSVFPRAVFSLSATGGLMQDTAVEETAVRPGVGLYGGAPGLQGPLETVARFEASILSVHDVKEGEAVGYDARWRAGRSSRIATLGAGYADGVLRSLGGSGAEMAVRGHRVPLVGAVSMDLATLDVTDAEDVAVGDWAEIFGDTVPLDEQAAKAGTIGYELLTAVRGRTRRIYADTSAR